MSSKQKGMRERISEIFRREKKDEPEELKLNDFRQWLSQESKRTGLTEQQVVEATFNDKWLTWIGETVKSSDNVLSVWGAPSSTMGVGEYRRLRKDFAPISRGINYIKSVILGSGVDIRINDPDDKKQKSLRTLLRGFIREVYQDRYTKRLYTVLDMMLDEALTVGGVAAQIVYEKDFDFLDYVDGPYLAKIKVNEKKDKKTQKITEENKKYLAFTEVKEPNWEKLGGIKRLKLIENSIDRLILYRDPNTWEDQYWTLDEVTEGQDINQIIGGWGKKKKDEEIKTSVLRYHVWEIFWLAVNRRDWKERGVSVIEPVVGLAKILEKILDAVGEGIYRAGHKKYFIICGSERRPWSEPFKRNVVQKVNDAGKKNWTTIPVPAGFDLKEIGGNVFEATQIINTLVTLIAQGLHVPIEVISGVQSRGAGERQFVTSHNELERMKNTFKAAVEDQLFAIQIWCKEGKEKTKQGGSSEPMYIPELKTSTRGLMSPIDRLEACIKISNMANPCDPLIKLEVDKDIADIMGYDDVKLQTQEDKKKELDEIAKALLEKGKSPEKGQGQPSPQTKERQKKRLEGIQERGIKTKNVGGPRNPQNSE